MNTCFQFDQWTFQADTYALIHSSGDSIQLEPRIGRLLEMFCLHPNQVLSRERIVSELWAPRVVSDDSLTVAISQLRRHLRQTNSASFIKTVSGRGYVWQPDTKPVIPTATTLLSSTRKAQWLAIGIMVSATMVISAVIFSPKPSMPNAAIPAPVFIEQLHQAAELVANEGDLDKAIQLYRDVLGEGANAAAYYGLAQAKLARISPHEIPVHADELTRLLERALEEDPTLPEAEWLLGMIHFYGHWDFAKAKTMLVAEFNRGNRSPRFLQQFSEVMLALREAAWVEQAITELRQHHPEFYAAPMLAWLHLLLGDTGSAQQEIARILDVEPTSYNLHVSAQHVAYQAGDLDMAWFHLNALLEQEPITGSSKVKLQKAFNDGGLAAVHSSLMDDSLSNRLGHYRPPIATARHALVAGEHERSIHYIQQAITERQWEVLWLLVDPHYAPLYEHPDFVMATNEFRRITGAN